MKICKLKLKNLNSFRDPIDLDFENPPLDDASIVAITGPTGAGKTTLLDAICVALYGKTPRLSGTGSQHPRHLISHGEKKDLLKSILWQTQRVMLPFGRLGAETLQRCGCLTQKITS